MSWSWRLGSPWAGIGFGPTAWAVSLQTNYALVPRLCEGRIGLISIFAALLTLVATAGALISLRAARAPVESQWLDSSGGSPPQFIAWVGVGSGLVFALAILNQLAATLIVNGCFR
jgi:hypothetical protein